MALILQSCLLADLPLATPPHDAGILTGQTDRHVRAPDYLTLTQFTHGDHSNRTITPA